MYGSIITLEGLDGSGKSTQIDLLVNRLNSEGVRNKFIHFPMLNKGRYGNMISEYLRGEYGSLHNVHPKLVALLFAEDRNEHKDTLNEWLEQGYLVIMDRYVNSNIAYQCAKTIGEGNKTDLKEWILDFEYNYKSLPKPTLSMFLHVPIGVIENNLSSRREGLDRAYLNGGDDIHENDFSLQRGVYNEYMSMIKNGNDLIEISCCSDDGNWISPIDIHNKIVNELKSANIIG